MTTDGKSLKERVRMIARRPRTLAVTGVAAVVLMLGIFCVACTGSREGVMPPTAHSLLPLWRIMRYPFPPPGRAIHPATGERAG